MFAAIKGHLHWFRYLGVHDLESPPLQPSPVAWARRFCDDWDGAGNSGDVIGDTRDLSTLVAVAKKALLIPSTGQAEMPVSAVSHFPVFTLRHPASAQTHVLAMVGLIEWPQFHAARADPSSDKIDQLMDAVDCDLAKLEFGCSPLQSLSEIVLALEWLCDIAPSPEEARIWATGAQILFQLSAAHGCDAQIDLAWTDRFRAEDANEPWARGQHSVDLSVGAEHVRILKQVAMELRSVLQGSYRDARDIADDVGDALETLWCGVIGGMLAK